MPKDWIAIDEPIYGFSTMQETMRVEDGALILGGIVRRYSRAGELLETKPQRDNVVLTWV
jgi:hypothetical protein